MTTKNSMEVTVSPVLASFPLIPICPNCAISRIGFRLLQTPSSTYAPSTIRNSAAPLAEPRLGGAGASVPRCCLPYPSPSAPSVEHFLPVLTKNFSRIGVSVDPCIPHSAFRLPAFPRLASSGLLYHPGLPAKGRFPDPFAIRYSPFVIPSVPPQIPPSAPHHYFSAPQDLEVHMFGHRNPVLAF